MAGLPFPSACCDSCPFQLHIRFTHKTHRTDHASLLFSEVCQHPEPRAGIRSPRESACDSCLLQITLDYLLLFLVLLVPLLLFYFLWCWWLNFELCSCWVSTLPLSYNPSQWDLSNVALFQKVNHHMDYWQPSLTNSPKPVTWNDNHLLALGIWGLVGGSCSLVQTWLVGCLDFDVAGLW